jgi:hypothetical protein
MRIIGVLGVALGGLFVIGAVTAYGQINTHSQYGGTTAAVVDDKGNLHVPSDYRTAYQVLGSWAVANDDGPGSKELHVVYASPGTIAAYRKDGHLPDGTVLVTEVFKTTTKQRVPDLTDRGLAPSEPKAVGARIYRAGESWSEPPGAIHSISRNAARQSRQSCSLSSSSTPMTTL